MNSVSIHQSIQAQLLEISQSLRSLAQRIQAHAPSTMELLQSWRRRVEKIDVARGIIPAVGAAVILGALYVMIRDPFSQPTPHSPEAVAARISPIGTLTLQEPAATQIAEQGSAPAAGMP